MRSLIAFLALAAPLVAADAAPPAPRAYPLTTCLVMGDAVDKDSPAVVVEGQEFKVCCKGCIKKIEKDPKGYVAKLAEAEKAAAEKAKAATPAK